MIEATTIISAMQKIANLSTPSSPMGKRDRETLQKLAEELGLGKIEFLAKDSGGGAVKLV